MVRRLEVLAIVALGLFSFSSCTPSRTDSSRPSSSASVRPSGSGTPSQSPEASSPAVEGLLYLEYSGGVGTSAPDYAFIVASLDGSNKVRRSLGAYARPNEVRFVQSRNGRYLAWSDHLELRTAASTKLNEAVTIAQTKETLVPLAISQNGDAIAYQILFGTEKAEGPSSAKLYIANVHNRSVRLIHTFDGPFIRCLSDASFDTTGAKLAAIGCGSGQEAGLLVIATGNGKVLVEDDGFRSWPRGTVFGHDLATVWLIDPAKDNSDIVRYEVASRRRKVLYHSQAWRQSDGSVAPNLGGLLLSADQTTLAFRRSPRDRIPEIYTIPSSGGVAAMLAKDERIGRTESWSPDGKYVTISLGRRASTPTQRLLLIDPRTRQRVLFDDTGATLNNFLAWIAS
jgi:hypothetical protein